MTGDNHLHIDKLLILYEPQDKLDEPPVVAKKIIKSGETSIRHLDEFRNTVTYDEHKK